MKKIPITIKDIAWAAGFLEGEGWFSKPPLAMRAAASQKDIQPLLKLQQIFGGAVLPQKGKPKYPNLNLWRISGYKCASMMMTIYELMSDRRKKPIREALMKWNKVYSWGIFRTHCKKGHRFDRENTYIYPKTGHRVCKICRKEWDKKRKRKEVKDRAC